MTIKKPIIFFSKKIKKSLTKVDLLDVPHKAVAPCLQFYFNDLCVH